MTNHTTTYKNTVGASQKGALTISLILGTLVSGFSEARPITIFDAPGAGTGAGGTFAININGFGVASLLAISSTPTSCPTVLFVLLSAR